jgi:hypothetical protein
LKQDYCSGFGPRPYSSSRPFQSKEARSNERSGATDPRLEAHAIAVVLVVDLSSLESQDSFDEQFEFWRQEIVENPSVWRGGFSIERLRLTISDFADVHGSDIMSSIKVWGK